MIVTKLAILISTSVATSEAFVLRSTPASSCVFLHSTKPSVSHERQNDDPLLQICKEASKSLKAAASTALVASALLFSPLAATAENELADIYGGKGFDSSLVDQTCLVDKCSLQAKACLADDPSCRKGLTCTAKCLGDNTCITGCMARYGDSNLDNLLKCTIEDNDCIKIAILDGGSDKYGSEPRSPAPTINNFDLKGMEGAWYKVAGYNPNYDCYACQRNTFSAPPKANPLFNDKLQVDVEFSMPHMLPDGSPPPPSSKMERVGFADDGILMGAQSIGYNNYATHELMVFDSPKTAATNFIQMGDKDTAYARTAHSEGEMFGLKFWENWYVIGENDPGQDEFKFVYYNGKTRQNTYEGAFVYSRTKNFDLSSMEKVYQIAKDAGLNPDQFCRIQNGCFEDSSPAQESPDAFRKFMASTKISQLLGVEPVAAEGVLMNTPKDSIRTEDDSRPWWNKVGDYLEDPNRHFEFMAQKRVEMDWSPVTLRKESTRALE